MEETDPYASARSVLRENVKWVASGVGAAMALVLAGLPFSGFGSLPILGARFVIAAVALAIAGLCFTGIMRSLIFTLRPDPIYAKYLRDGYAPQHPMSDVERKEISELRKTFEDHKSEFLPDGIDSFKELEEHVDKLWAAAEASKNPGDFDELKRYEDNLAWIHAWAAYARLHARVEGGMKRLQRLGLLALLALAVFALASNPAKSRDEGSSGAVIVTGARDRAGEDAALPKVERLDPVLFETGRAALTDDALRAIGTARDALRRRTDSALLVFAHTDTVGGSAINRRLARRRATAVRDELIVHGGIAAARVFQTDLPEADLPVLTGEETARDENRSVEMLLVALPAGR